MPKGCRPFSKEEVHEIQDAFEGRDAVRNRTLIVLGCNLGLRVSELLSIDLGDVQQNGSIVDSVYIKRSATKGKTEGRALRLNKHAKAALLPLLEQLAGLPANTPLFHTQYKGTRRMTRRQVCRIIKAATVESGMTGKLGTHCLRKTFADRMYELLGRDLVRLQAALGHKWVTSTSAYVSFKQDDIDDAIDKL